MKILNKLFQAKYYTFIFMSCIFLSSCGGAKYTYFFDEGKYLDFSEGTWILNNTKSNSEGYYDAELYNTAKFGFRRILGDSLLEINDVRATKLIPPKINFNLSKEELIKLHDLSACDFLINIKGNIISNDAGSIAIAKSDEPDYYHKNEATASIKIYDLKLGTLISSSLVNGKAVDESSAFDNKSHTYIMTSAHRAMVNGASNLIAKYHKYGTRNKKSK